jgi:hypothetical protein
LVRKERQELWVCRLDKTYGLVLEFEQFIKFKKNLRCFECCGGFGGVFRTFLKIKKYYNLF